MKKSLLLVAVLLSSLCGFAQKSNFKEIKMCLYGDGADFYKARRIMLETLENDETKDMAEAWYLAGYIGYQQYSQLYLLYKAGGKVNEAEMGQAITESLDYFIKADSLALIPTYDKKGREHYNTKVHNDVVKSVKEYYVKRGFVDYGSYLNDQEDFVGAYHAFMDHLRIPNLSMMQDEKTQAEMPKDSIYYLIKYFAANMAMRGEMHKEAIALLEQMKDGNCEPIKVNQYLYQQYFELKDTANYIAVLEYAMDRFPQEPWFLQNLINHYIYSNQEEVAIKYLDKAIEREPGVAVYHMIQANLFVEKENFDAALAAYDRAIELDPKLADAVAGKGRAYYNQAVKINTESSYIMDGNEYDKALNKMNDMFRQSLPFFEQAHEIDPENRDYMVILKGLYYRFSMDDKYKAIQEELEK